MSICCIRRGLDDVFSGSDERPIKVRNNIGVRVQCYSGSKADERPVRFELDEQEYMVEEILDRWYGPEDTFFKVRADDNNIYILRHSPAEDVWSLESFRRE